MDALQWTSSRVVKVWVCLSLSSFLEISRFSVKGFELAEVTHYLDYIPYRQSGLAYFEDFRTATAPPIHLRNRKIEVNSAVARKIDVENILERPLWPRNWPYSFEDFRPLDYTRDEPIDVASQYEFSHSMMLSDKTAIIPGLLRLPINRHFVFPKDKFALKEHMKQYFKPGSKVLELFSCHESIIPTSKKLGPVVGVGWYEKEMQCNPLLDDYIAQDITVDPYLPLADNYFDFVVVPAMFQLFQRPKEMFQEINRVLKPGGIAFIGVKLVMWSFLGLKQGRYYVETNYLEDVLAVGSFFHYSGGYSKPQSFDLTLPEVSMIGKIKDVLFPSPRLDFYACVQAKKKLDSPHGKDSSERVEQEHEVEGQKYRPTLIPDPSTQDSRYGPFY